MPGGDRHVMSSAPGMRAEPAMDIYRHPGREALPYVFADFGGGGAPTRYACGFLGYDARPFNPVARGAAAADARLRRRSRQPA